MQFWLVVFIFSFNWLFMAQSKQSALCLNMDISFIIVFTARANLPIHVLTLFSLFKHV